MNSILSALQNKHTTIAGGAYVLAEVGSQILSIWMPSHATQFQQTAEKIKAAAVLYMGLAAGDASRSASKQDLKQVAQDTAFAIQTGNTTVLTKPIEQKEK